MIIRRKPHSFSDLARMVCFWLWINMSLSVSQSQSLLCVTCSEASSNHECNLNGITQTCVSEEASCFSEIRIHGGVYSIRKGCMQERSCRVQASANSVPSSKLERYYEKRKRCNDGYDNSVCHYCCAYDHCNVAETPLLIGRNQSCLQFLPFCRSSVWNERNGFIPVEGQGVPCHCDTLCEMNGDCCADYRDVCVGVLPKYLRDQDPFGGATGGEYGKILPRGGGLPLLRCFICKDASSNEDCNNNGEIVECQANQRSCVTEVRIRYGKRRISKRCEQTKACQTLQQSAPTCSDGDVCFSCCDVSYCNVVERPHQNNLTSSCLKNFPGFPQCKRVSLSTCQEGDTRCASRLCKCDSDCKRFQDCCPDYDELCATPETTNLRWIFREIIRNQRRSVTPVGGTGIVERDGFIPFHEATSSRFTILHDYPTEMELTPDLIEEMIRERKEKVALFHERWGRKEDKIFSGEDGFWSQILNAKKVSKDLNRGRFSKRRYFAT